MKPRALIAVANKTGVVEFARKIVEIGWEIVSTGKTARYLSSGCVTRKTVEEVTGFPEILGGRVKTLHPGIFGGILPEKGNPEHMQTLNRLGIIPIEMVVVNFYDFAVNKCTEEIDIGGPALLRAGAKNYREVIVIVDPGDYDSVAAALASGKGVDNITRSWLAAKVFDATADYDRLIADHMEECFLKGVEIERGRPHTDIALSAV
ncbi:MAG: phosphoribosylaminoimidazolecarboxamide formyltransferase / cyclohydrolase [Candidatus Parcubacteria bacterium]|nr:phosphoribosylaminoimidazolecarboxamide formyltransferase / cyclohydrolase [Candidatus Parcubacteria bacterium]